MSIDLFECSGLSKQYPFGLPVGMVEPFVSCLPAVNLEYGMAIKPTAIHQVPFTTCTREYAYLWNKHCQGVFASHCLTTVWTTDLTMLIKHTCPKESNKRTKMWHLHAGSTQYHTSLTLETSLYENYTRYIYIYLHVCCTQHTVMQCAGYEHEIVKGLTFLWYRWAQRKQLRSPEMHHEH